ncbi:Aste57867_14970 [Aphanomyces stellatus]|uniref:Aste57867_14970 protein n=1 Tax=Aphanomyces stellatus TaxID=120398 RepID=A0A485L2X5_9STRA|nr:hypothetical protein As57867_014914 [Aphanomyces stellatus]VFT91784.1 Aste57867_14970 [Aphanomyces stellatus]
MNMVSRHEDVSLTNARRNASPFDPMVAWQWTSAQTGFLAAQELDPSLTPLERWYYEARDIARQAPTTSAAQSTATEMTQPCLDVCYRKAVPAHEVGSELIRRCRLRMTPTTTIHELLTFRSMHQGRVAHVLCCRVNDALAFACDFPVDVQTHGAKAIADGASIHALLQVLRM